MYLLGHRLPHLKLPPAALVHPQHPVPRSPRIVPDARCRAELLDQLHLRTVPDSALGPLPVVRRAGDPAGQAGTRSRVPRPRRAAPDRELELAPAAVGDPHVSEPDPERLVELAGVDAVLLDQP